VTGTACLGRSRVRCHPA